MKKLTQIMLIVLTLLFSASVLSEESGGSGDSGGSDGSDDSEDSGSSGDVMTQVFDKDDNGSPPDYPVPPGVKDNSTSHTTSTMSQPNRPVEQRVPRINPTINTTINPRQQPIDSTINPRH